MSFRFHFILLLLIPIIGISQDEKKWQVNGAYQGNANFFIKDERIGAANIPQYEEGLIGIDSWLNLNVGYKGFRAGARFDVFRNSNLLNPTAAYSDVGIGIWFLEKEFEKLSIRIGSIYNQIGSGIIYRAYEERPLLIDNALKGGQLDYSLNDDWNISVFAGQQRFLFSKYKSFLTGVKLEGFLTAGKEEKILLSPGIGITSRSSATEVTDKLVSVLKNYVGDQRIDQFSYDTYATSIYNTLNYKTFSWYLELAYKFPDIFFDPNSLTTKVTGAESQGRYLKKSGSVFYTTLSYAKKGLGITLEAKRTENFDFRVDQTLTLNNGLIGFLPPMNHITTYRLTSRYNPATQLTSELAFQFDLNYKINKKYSVNFNASNISTLEYDQLYRELYIDLLFKPNRNFISHWGIQHQFYNQAVYEGKPKSITPNLSTITPFIDILYKINRKNSIRIESQYMSTKQDYGSWIYLLAEYGLVPNWRFELSGMFNVIPNPGNPNIPEGAGKKILYPTAGVVYLQKSNRYSLRYVKQVEGVVCTGGICRLEPAFSGVKFEISSIF